MIAQVEKLPTGIAGFDFVTNGGLPRGRTTLVAGTAGSAKTVFAAQFLVEGIRQFREAGVFVTFEESPDDIRRNFGSMGWDIAAWEREGKWAFVDVSPVPGEQPVEAGSYDLGALMARIEAAVRRTGAARISIDSLGSIFLQLSDEAVVRRELFRVASVLRTLGVTGVITAERLDEYGHISRHGVEEFVADNVVVFRNVLDGEKRRRTLEVLKFRGCTHQKGEYPFTIAPGDGLVAIPLSAIELEQHSSNVRITTGSQALDEMTGGGFFRDSIILASGATGTGKTLLTSEFIRGGCERGERCLLLAFEESREQLFRNAAGWGMQFERYEADGVLRVACAYPESASLEDHLIHMKALVREFRPQRVAVDSLSALERVSSMKGFREFVIGLTSYIKHQEVAGLFTATTPTLAGGESVTEAHISTITDSIIMLRYVEIFGEMRRGLTVLKMRGSPHDKQIREFNIDRTGMHIGRAFRGVTGILTGSPRQVPVSELERLDQLFPEA